MSMHVWDSARCGSDVTLLTLAPSRPTRPFPPLRSSSRTCGWAAPPASTRAASGRRSRTTTASPSTCTSTRTPTSSSRGCRCVARVGLHGLVLLPRGALHCAAWARSQQRPPAAAHALRPCPHADTATFSVLALSKVHVIPSPLVPSKPLIGHPCQPLPGQPLPGRPTRTLWTPTCAPRASPPPCRRSWAASSRRRSSARTSTTGGQGWGCAAGPAGLRSWWARW